MSDLVEHLRTGNHRSCQNMYAHGGPDDSKCCPECHERLAAADEIERLRAANTELVEALANWWEDGISDDPDHHGHADWCWVDGDKPQDCICGRVTIDRLEADHE